MPADLDGLLRPLQKSFRDETALIVPMFDQLRRSVERLAKHADDLERSTRGHPVLRFYADALTVSVAPAQHGLIRLDGAIDGVGAALTAGLRDFRAGIGWIGTAVAQELALPELLWVARGATGTVADSLQRFADPASLFQPGTRSASDLFGELGLMFRTVALPSGGTTGAQEILGAATIAKNVFGSPGESTSQTPFDPAQFAATLDDLGWELFGVMVVLPLVPAVRTVVEAGVTLAEGMLTAELQRAEAALGPLRRGVADVMRAVLTAAQTTENFLTTYGWVIEGVVALSLALAEHYVARVLDELRRWASGVSDMLEGWRKVAEGIRSFFALLLDTDLMPFLLGPLYDLLPSGMTPRLTLDMLVDVGGDVALGAARVAMSAAADVLAIVLPLRAQPRVEAFRKVAAILLSTSPLMETGLPPPAPPFPDVAAAFLHRPETAAMAASLARLGHDLPIRVHMVLDAGATASAAMAESFHEAAARAATFPRDELAGVAAEAHAQATLVRGVLQPGPPVDEDLAQVARSFEQQLARGGIMLAAAAIPVLAAQLRRRWQQRAVPAAPDRDAQRAGRRPAPPPTSPHHLATRARVTTVTTPRILIRLPVHELDDALIGEVVEAFGSGALEAWELGNRRGPREPAGAGYGR